MVLGPNTRLHNGLHAAKNDAHLQKKASRMKFEMNKYLTPKNTLIFKNGK